MTKNEMTKSAMTMTATTTTQRKFWHVAIAALWASLPAIYFQYADAWGRLPVRMSTHFDINGHPNGWAPRETSMWFIMGVTAFVVVLGTILLARIRKPEAAAWGVLAMFYVVLAVLYRASAAVIEYNLSGNFLSVAWEMKVLIVAVVAIILLSVVPRRGLPLQDGDFVAEEVHSSTGLAIIFGAAALCEIIAAFAIHIPVARIGLLTAAAIFIAITAMTASGFQYLFRRTGLEIRTLGFRLRSVPLAQIQDYAMQPWSWVRGYGIRGTGASRAYTWGNRVVRIKTSDGEVFLGHDNPERIVHDLDLIRQTAH
jgi:hypothetical protein